MLERPRQFTVVEKPPPLSGYKSECKCHCWIRLMPHTTFYAGWKLNRGRNSASTSERNGAWSTPNFSSPTRHCVWVEGRTHRAGMRDLRRQGCPLIYRQLPRLDAFFVISRANLRFKTRSLKHISLAATFIYFFCIISPFYDGRRILCTSLSATTRHSTSHTPRQNSHFGFFYAVSKRFILKYRNWINVFWVSRMLKK